MPNWSICKVTVNGNGSDEFIRRARENYEHGLLNHFIPMPKTYDLYDTTNYSAIGRKEALHQLKVGDKYFAGPDAEAITVTDDFIRRFAEAKHEQAEIYGAVGWQEWQSKYRGVKWDCRKCRFTDNSISFNTAWNPPIVAFKTISKMFPEVTFTLDFFVEYSLVEGVFTIKNGKEHKASDKCSLKEEERSNLFKDAYESAGTGSIPKITLVLSFDENGEPIIGLEGASVGLAV